MIELSSVEKDTAESSVRDKYVPALLSGIISSIFIIPSLLFLKPDVVLTVLIPVTMVAGTAWFSVSLASIKKKFENFGLELTKNLFSAFVISISMLFWATVASLTHVFWGHKLASIEYQQELKIISAFFGIIVVGNLMYQIFLGSLKYDMNDAMLTGQNEAAEKYFKKALSTFHSTAATLREPQTGQSFFYFIGISFLELFIQLKKSKDDNMAELLIEKAYKLTVNPSMKREKANEIVKYLIQEFILVCSKNSKVKNDIHYTFVKRELNYLNSNTNDQAIINARVSVIFEEIANLLEDYGETLFLQST